jgi:hypothetical protein
MGTDEVSSFPNDWEAFRGDDEPDDHLHTVWAFIPTVAKLALVSFLKGWLALENRCWLNRRAALRNGHQKDPASVGADDRRAAPCA